MKQSELQAYMMKHTADLRKTLPDPDEETLAIWEFENKKSQAILDILKRREESGGEVDGENFNIKLSSEVKIK